jgi:hypothetical protein
MVRCEVKCKQAMQESNVEFGVQVQARCGVLKTKVKLSITPAVVGSKFRAEQQWT